MGRVLWQIVYFAFLIGILAALIAEEIGRSLLLVVGFGLLVWLVALAIITVSIARTRQGAGHPPRARAVIP
jgi:hypothetical protein